MTFHPVVERELRVASRRQWSYWGRSAAAAVVLLVVAWFVVLERSLSLNQFGHQLFGVTTFLAGLFAVLAGVVYTADSLAAERRDGTLGLLFLTDLKGYDVLFGKMAASSIGCLFHLVASFPIMAIAILMGGVTAGEYLRMMALLFNVLLCSLSLGMLASTLSPDSKRAAAIALMFALGLVGFMPALGGIVYWLGWKFDVPTEVRDSLFEDGYAWASPAVAYFGAFDDGYRSKPQVYPAGMTFVGCITVLALSLSAFRLPRLWQDKPASIGRRGFIGRIEAWRWPNLAARAAWRTRLLESSPLVWLSGRYWMRGVSIWILLAVCAVIFGIFGLEVGKEWFEAPTFITTSILIHLALKLWIASEAPRQFHEDRRSGGMELLLSTPLSIEDIVEGRMRALQRQFGGPIFLVLMVDVVFLLTGIKGAIYDSAGEWSTFWLSRMILLVLDAHAMGWSGMWIGMKVSGNRTTGHVLLRILVVPWLMVAVLLTFFGLLSFSGSSPLSGFGSSGFLVLWLLLCAANDIFWLASARRHLLGSFRDLGTTRPGEKKSAAAA